MTARPRGMTATGPNGRTSAGELAALYAVAACTGDRCGRAAVRWIPTARQHPTTGAPLLSGKPIPLDHGRDPHGLLVLDQDPRDRKLWTVRPFDDGDRPDRPRYSVHWQVCHTPGLYTRIRAAADPRGILPPIARPRAGNSARWGPCSVCGAQHGNHYGTSGPGEQPSSPLCDDCAAVAIARWSPAFRCAQGLESIPVPG